MFKNQPNQNVNATILTTAGAPVTGGTTTVYVTGDNGVRTAGAGVVASKTGGDWNYTPTQAETNYDHVKFTFSNDTTDAITVGINVYTSNKNLDEGADQLYVFTVGAGPTASSIPTDITGAPYTTTNHFKDRVVSINQETKKILGSSGSPVVLSVIDFVSVPSQNDIGVIS